MTPIKLHIEKAVYGGNGLAYHDGKTYFVPYALPGDIVLAEVYQNKKDYSFASIKEITQPSPKRITPKCPNFGICGGCDYLNTDYPEELNIKKNILIESLNRIAGLKTIPEIEVINSDRFDYRSHASIKCSTNKNGFYQKDTNTVIPFPENGCLQLSKTLNNYIQNDIKTKNSEIKIACSYNSECKSSLNNKCVIEEHEYSLIFQRDINNFFQANRFLRSRMLEIADELAKISGKEFIDIGCGVGFFALYLAKNSSGGIGIDIDKTAISWAKHNSKLNKIDNIKFYEKSFSEMGLLKKNYETIIADPPRAGLTADARNAIKAGKAQRIVYVSCNPATFSRDLKDLSDKGFKLHKLYLIDMFPCTYHIEIISLLSR